MIEIEWSKCSVLLFKAKSGSKSYPYRTKNAYVAIHPDHGVVAVADPEPFSGDAACCGVWTELLFLPDRKAFVAEVTAREVHVVVTPKMVKDTLRVAIPLRKKFIINRHK